MMRILLIVVIALLATVPCADASDIYHLIMEGRLDEARDSLSNKTTAALRDGNMLFFQSLVEVDADQSARMMEAALKASVDPFYREKIYYRLAQYYVLTEKYRALGKIVAQYRSLFEEGRYARQMERLAVLASERTGSPEAALRQADRNLIEFTREEDQQWGLVDKARLMAAMDKSIGHRSQIAKLARQKRGPGVPQAVYLMALDAVGSGQTDVALFYYNVLREGFGPAVGLAFLTETLSGSPDPGPELSPEAASDGSYFTVKVGVFSQEDNAERRANRFKVYGHEVEIGHKKISGVSYRVVYVGRFDRRAAAAAFKQQLEQEHGEVFQVVSR